MAKHRLTAKHWKFYLPTASDNTNKFFTTAQPLCDFLQDVAAWSACNHVRLQVTHLPGEKNTWADELSRNKLHRFAHRAKRFQASQHLTGSRACTQRLREKRARVAQFRTLLRGHGFLPSRLTGTSSTPDAEEALVRLRHRGCWRLK